MKTVLTIFAIAILATCNEPSYSQVAIPAPALLPTKTFTGELGDGKMTYHYYEDSNTGNRIRHGAFKYSEYTAVDGAVYSVLFTGNYNHGFKDGSWKYLITRKDVLVDDGVYQTGSINLLLSYKSGMPNGVWSYSENNKLRKHKYTQGGWIWGAFEIVPSQSVIVNFKNGVVAGPFKMKTDYFDVSGQFDVKGLMTGKWSIIDVGISQIELDALNGVVSKFVKRNVSNGKVLFRSDYDAELLLIQTKISKLSRDGIDSLCQSNKLKIDTLPSSNMFDYKEFFDKRIFMHSETEGDKTIVVEDRGTFDRRNYGFYILVERIKQ
ncbi:hypothetical protein [Williamwhitmania taraxaci]|uniref:Uncharacterized protein n=1 Tax=Williamwhitmania taraxaci TaxID=1640674 RepID=A0A1G6QXH8_9BACT|nr:hypothetical protein [Williamwhitmania taraxaci]SDC96467.1 hypothetical protein SAMN05216323_106623 [Williamwhitmania taraxaci]